VRDGSRVGPYFDVFDAPGRTGTIKVGITHGTFQRLSRHGLATMIAQYYGIVQDGLRHARHLYRGLNRPLLHANNMNADEDVFIYSWRPALDFIWLGGRHDGNPRSMTPPAGRVFVVLVRDHGTPDEHGVSGTIEHWNWTHEDPTLRDAPVDWAKRYATNEWSK